MTESVPRVDLVRRAALIVAIAALLGVLLMLIVGIVRTLGLSDPIVSDAPNSMRWEPPSSTLSLPEAEARAASRARDWSEDVYLVRAEGAWRADEGWQTATNLPIAWTFYYFSPSQLRLAIVTVMDDKLSWVAPMALSSDPSPLPFFPPLVDLGTAWMSFRDGEGGTYLARNTGSLVDMRLMAHDDRSVWRLSASADDAYVRVTLDSQTGEMISSELK